MKYLLPLLFVLSCAKPQPAIDPWTETYSVKVSGKRLVCSTDHDRDTAHTVCHDP